MFDSTADMLSQMSQIHCRSLAAFCSSTDFGRHLLKVVIQISIAVSALNRVCFILSVEHLHNIYCVFCCSRISSLVSLIMREVTGYLRLFTDSWRITFFEFSMQNILNRSLFNNSASGG